jgi:phage shock protein A
LVDAVENTSPEMVMKESIREVDSARDELRAQLGKIVANKHNTNKRIMSANSEHETLSDQIQISIREDRDDLAETAIARQMDIEAQVSVLEGALSEATAEERELEAYIHALDARKREMEQALLDFLSSRRESDASAEDQTRSGMGAARTVEDAEAAFNRVLANETSAPLAAPKDHKTATHLTELKDLERKNHVQQRLAKLKVNVE